MKKVLFATTALVFSAGFAAAEVSISGYGRFGASYDSSADDNDSQKSTSWIEQRLRLNIDALTTTDGGVEFGGRIRLQFDDGNDSTGTAPALLYVSYGGLRVEVGNANTAFDSDPLAQNSEIGLTERSFGDPRSAFLSYNTYAYDTDNRTGIYAQYSIAGFTARGSYVDPDQKSDDQPIVDGIGLVSEKSVSFSYETGPLTISAAGNWDSAGIKKNNVWFIGGLYQFTDQFSAGLNYIDEGYEGWNKEGDLGKTVVVYGTYAIDAVALHAYIANNDADDNKSDTTYGLGADYDLGGGTKLLGSIERGYGSKSSDKDEETIAQFGVKFNF